MPWLRTADRTHRAAVTWAVDGVKPPKVEMGAEWVDLWAHAQSNGYDLLAADAQGTVLTHQRDTWSTSDRQAIIRIALPSTLPGAATTGVIYLYWGSATTIAVDPSSTVSGTAVAAYAVPPGTLAGVEVVAAPPVPAGNAYAPRDELLAPVDATTVAVLPVALARLDTAARGGREVEDVAGLAAVALDADGAGVDPSAWVTVASVRLALDAERGAAAVVPVVPAAAGTATLRLRAYVLGPYAGGLPARTAPVYARLRAVVPQES